MGLERTYKSVTNLDHKEKITIAQMLDFIALFAEEVFEYNGISLGDVSAMERGNREDLVINAYALCDLLASVVRQNEEFILKWDDSSELQDVFGQINEMHAELEKKSEMAKKLSSQKERLESERAWLKIENEKLLKAQKECEILEDDIRRLSDPVLAGMEKKRDELREELNRRKEAHEGICAEIGEYNLRIDEVENKVSKAKGERSQKEVEYGNVVKQKEELETTIQELENRRSECKLWIEEFRAKNSEIIRNCEEYGARFAQIYTAINSIFMEQYIRDHLFSVGGSSKLQPDNYPDLSIFSDKIESIDDFRGFLDKIQKRIESLLNVYQEELKKLVECSKMITKDEKEAKHE